MEMLWGMLENLREALALFAGSMNRPRNSRLYRESRTICLRSLNSACTARISISRREKPDWTMLPITSSWVSL